MLTSRVALVLALCTSCIPAGPSSQPPDRDADGDGLTVSNDCDDGAATAHAGATEIPYDGIDQDCDGTDLVDMDGDGWIAVEAGGDDCDDQDPLVKPGGYDVPYDGVDQDCLDGDLVDVDGDGHAAEQAGGDDCDDGSALVHPGVVDDCTAGDQDCDGVENEDEDPDGDGETSCAGDCDDQDPGINTGATEVPEDGIDQNCNGMDMGDCGADAYADSHRLWVEVDASCDGGCNIYGFFYSDELDSSWQLPEDATCSGGIATWSGSLGGLGGGQINDGNFTLNLTTGCGTVASDDASYSCASCDNISGYLGFTQACVHP